MLFTAGNLLPPQVIIAPLYRIYLRPADAPAAERQRAACTTSTSGIIDIHVAFQIGFCTFVLSNYMKTLPKELNEAALRRRGRRLADLLERDHAAHAGRPSRRWRPWSSP